ncbi:MAG: DUF1080 domain-containing protein [bacterium]|nr:DUF1080 domain-containing protein [bacterium]
MTPNASFDGWSEYGWPPGSGTLESPSGLWTVDSDTGYLCCSGADGHTALMTDQTFADFKLHLEYRFAAQPNVAPSRLNSGVLVRMDPTQYVMHQIETRGDEAGFFIGGSLRDGKQTFLRSLRPGDGQWIDGATHTCRGWEPMIRISDSTPPGERRPDASALGDPSPVVIHPPGEWNTYDVVARGSQITVWTNGVISCYTDRCDIPRGHFGVEAEYWPIEFRNIRVRELDR